MGSQSLAASAVARRYYRPTAECIIVVVIIIIIIIVVVVVIFTLAHSLTHTSLSPPRSLRYYRPTAECIIRRGNRTNPVLAEAAAAAADPAELSRRSDAGRVTVVIHHLTSSQILIIYPPSCPAGQDYSSQIRVGEPSVAHDGTHGPHLFPAALVSALFTQRRPTCAQAAGHRVRAGAGVHRHQPL